MMGVGLSQIWPLGFLALTFGKFLKALPCHFHGEWGYNSPLKVMLSVHLS